MKQLVSVVSVFSLLLLLLLYHDGENGFVSVCQASSSHSNFGTRITGAGSHGRRNRSIFTTTKQQYQNKTIPTTITPEDEKETSLLYGTWNQQQPNQFVFKLLLPQTITKNNLTKTKYTKVMIQLSVSTTNINNKDKDKNKNTQELLSVEILENDPTTKSTMNDKKKKKKKEKKNSQNDDWIPLEGIYGIYQLPSGWHLVLISSSELVYNCSLFQIRKVTSMEIVPLSRKKLRHYQQMCEERQLSLLRQSFKEHDFYFATSPNTTTSSITSITSSSSRIQDITQPLERKYHPNYSHNNDGNSNTNTILPIHPSSSTKWWTSLVHPTTREEEVEGMKKNKTLSSNYNSQNETTQLIPDSRFFWNQDMIQPFLRNYSSSKKEKEALDVLLGHIIIPVTSAFVGIQTNISLTTSNIKNNMNDDLAHSYDQIVISRRCKYRAGTRFTRRGADEFGYVANYVETEQMILFPQSNEVYSHLQTRGSIPLRWASPTDVKTYRPRVLIGTDPLAQARALRSHVLDQLLLYTNHKEMQRSTNTEPRLAFINLIDKHSDQGRLGKAFDSVLQAVLDVHSSTTTAKGGKQPPVLWKEDVRHVWFDFHAECKGGRWDRLTHLLQDVTKCLDVHGYFAASYNETNNEISVQSTQKGVVRTNCMDCLDRTNVVQSMFARYVLFQQLQQRCAANLTKRKRFLPLENVVGFKRQPLKLPWAEGETSHRLLWADNADAISRLYAGTPALKGDFTRTGKRTKRGALDDGMNSLQRYYLNNFKDADRQEGVDLLLGKRQFSYTTTEDEIMDYNLLMEEEEENNNNMSLEDASRAAILESSRNKKQTSYARIKPSKKISGTYKIPGKRQSRRIQLDWLSGDLQSHMKSAIYSNSLDTTLSQQEKALNDINRRGANDDPWWVTSIDDKFENNTNPIKANGKQILGALIAILQAPVVSAVVVVSYLLPGMLITKENDKKKKDHDNN